MYILFNMSAAQRSRFYNLDRDSIHVQYYTMTPNRIFNFGHSHSRTTRRFVRDSISHVKVNSIRRSCNWAGLSETTGAKRREATCHSFRSRGHSAHSKMFRWEPDGRYRHWLCTLLVLNGTSLNIDRAFLVLKWLTAQIQPQYWTKMWIAVVENTFARNDNVNVVLRYTKSYEMAFRIVSYNCVNAIIIFPFQKRHR